MPPTRGEARRDRSLALPEQHDVHRHLTQRDDHVNGAQRDPGISAVEGTGRNETERETPCITPDRERAIGRCTSS